MGTLGRGRGSLIKIRRLTRTENFGIRSAHLCCTPRYRWVPRYFSVRTATQNRWSRTTLIVLVTTTVCVCDWSRGPINQRACRDVCCGCACEWSRGAAVWRHRAYTTHHHPPGAVYVPSCFNSCLMRLRIAYGDKKLLAVDMKVV